LVNFSAHLTLCDGHWTRVDTQNGCWRSIGFPISAVPCDATWLTDLDTEAEGEAAAT